MLGYPLEVPCGPLLYGEAGTDWLEWSMEVTLSKEPQPLWKVSHTFMESMCLKNLAQIFMIGLLD